MRKTEEKEERAIKAIGLFLAIAVIVLTAVFLYSPVFKTHASKSYIENGKNKVSARLQTMIAMNFSTEKLSFEMNPVSGGSFKSLPINVSVTTNDPTGYQIYMSALDGVDLTSSATTDKVTSITESATSSDMPVNTWGYSVDNTTFHAIPASDNPALIAQVFERTQNSLTTINYGVKVDNNLDMAKYTDTLVLTAVAYNAGRDECGDGFFCIEYMQDMTPEICEATPTPSPTATEITTIFIDGEEDYVPRTTLVDKRDGKEYLVSKLADGNCWMSSDLDLILNDQVALTSELTDLNTKETWTPGHSTSVPEESEIPTSATHQQEVVPTNPTWDRYDENQEYSLTADFLAAGDTVDTWDVLTEYHRTYYTSQAATTRSSQIDFTQGEVTTDSICPRGWQLPNPQMYDYDNNPDKSYNKLLSVYTPLFNANGVWAITLPPLDFHSTGYVYYATHDYSDDRYELVLNAPGRLYEFLAEDDNILLYETYYYSLYATTTYGSYGSGHDPYNPEYGNRAYVVRCVAR